VLTVAAEEVGVAVVTSTCRLQCAARTRLGPRSGVVARLRRFRAAGGAVHECCLLRQLLDDFEELGAVVAALAAELDEFECFGEHGAALRRPGKPADQSGAQRW